MNALKSMAQLEDLRRRKLLGLSPDGPMVRLYREPADSQFGHLPTAVSLSVHTPLGHYKTKLLELGLDPRAIMRQVAAQLRMGGNVFAFHNENGRYIGSRMYDAMKYIVCKKYGTRQSEMRILSDIFID